MEKFLGISMLLSVIMMVTIIGVANAQIGNTTPNNMGNGTTGAVTNLTNASTSLQDAKNMSAIEGTMNQTG
jgi:hypothetical protein